MVEEKNNGLAIFSKVFAGVILILGIVLLFYAKKSKPEFSTGLFILILILLIIIAVFFFFGPKKIINTIKSKITPSEENEEFNVPKSIGLGDAIELFNQYFLFNQKYGKSGRKIMKEGTEIHGKIKPQRIYYRWFEDTEGTEWFFAVNMHFPEVFVIIDNPSAYEISEAKRRLVVFKEDEKDTKESITIRPDGTQTVYKEKSEPQEKPAPKKQKEDLVGGDE